MSLPRRAMVQMGFSICCLTCDAPDSPGSLRCRQCIERHSSARESLSTGEATTKAQRLARELINMISNPRDHVFDEDHGKWMESYAELIEKHEKSSVEKSHRNYKQKSRNKSIIREIANQNKWANAAPEPDEIDEILSVLKEEGETAPMTWDELILEIEDLLDDVK